jgi:mono/diheme cytochrome c family protein
VVDDEVRAKHKLVAEEGTAGQGKTARQLEPLWVPLLACPAVLHADWEIHSRTKRLLFCSLVISSTVLASTIATSAEPTAAEVEFFEKEIRPLLVARCFKCHGELKEPKGGLSLTSREDVLKGGESGPAAIAGKPDESLLISAIKYEGPEMPPDGNQLPDAAIANLTRWVELGLPWPKSDAKSLEPRMTAVEDEQIAAARRSHWSLQPVRSPQPPKVRDAIWAKTSIDDFVLAELEKHGLTPSPRADKRTLLRRVTFDLVGLPPTPEEIDDFQRDDSPKALERVVDRLLASPGYGQRWGRHWLDVARYADTKGYVLFQDDKFPWSYTYRDYVVRALNEDLPYDRFITEQLAADLLPLGNDRRPLTALGFLTLGNGFMNNQQDVIDDRIDVVTRGLLGLTVTCARCHDHKFDPIPTADYYSLYGVMASCTEATIPPLFEDPPQTEAYAAFAKELAERERKLNEYLDEKYRALADGARSRVAEYLLTANTLKGKPTTEDFMLLADGNDLNPTMVIRYQVFLERSRAAHDAVLAIWHALAALPADQFASKAREVVEQLIAERAAKRPINPIVADAFLRKPLKELADAAQIYGELLSDVDRQWQSSVAQASAAKEPPPAALADPNAEALRQVFYGPQAPANFSRSEIGVLALLPDRPAQEARTKLLKAIEEWRATGPAAPPRAMVLEDLPTPVRQRVFVRGNPNQLGAEVPRRFLRVLCDGAPVAFGGGSGRLELARAITDPKNPLTARVLVNRVWLQHFGKPLVGTPSDFGLRGDPPTHPDLLDHLASSFMDGGWSIKRLHRQIVLSAAYQQASDDRAECRKVDPENTWLWKANRRRLDFEATRDALLAVSGRLDTKLGGPPMPSLTDPASTRRTLYGFVDRLNLPGVFRTFDFPNPDSTNPERSLTTIPQQALFFMNNPLVMACAKGLLARADVAGEADDAKKLRRLYLVSLGREPAAEELDWARQFLSSAASRPAVWDEFAQALLLSNEFVFVD